MAIYEAYLPPAGKHGGDTESAFLNARFVKDGLAPLALVIPFLWLLWNRLWLEAIAFLIIAFAVGALSQNGWSAAGLAISLLPGLYLFLEGRELVAGKLRRNGWRFAGVVEADSPETAERRFFENAGSSLPDTGMSNETHEVVQGVVQAAGSAGGADPWGRAARTGMSGQDKPDFGIFSED